MTSKAPKKPGGTGVYQEMGVKRVVNAMGHMTVLGGSTLTPTVLAAMEEANKQFVSMDELLVQAGKVIAGLLETEAALVTSGCASAIALGTAGMMTGSDPAKIARLPDTGGMKNEFLIQKKTRYHYDRMATVHGGKLVEVGSPLATTAYEVEEAIGPRTAGVLYFAQMQNTEGVLSVAEVAEIAHPKGVGVIVDAAAESYPLDYMKSFYKAGADLVCFGGKYFNAPHSTGVLCGRRDFVQNAYLNGFIQYEMQDNHSFGRAMKVDRQEVVGAVAALREWFTMNHETRILRMDARLDVIERALKGIPGVSIERGREQTGPGGRMTIHIVEDEVGKKAQDIADRLHAGDPSIWVWVQGHTINMGVANLLEGEEELVAHRLREELTGR